MGPRRPDPEDIRTPTTPYEEPSDPTYESSQSGWGEADPPLKRTFTEPDPDTYALPSSDYSHAVGILENRVRELHDQLMCFNPFDPISIREMKIVVDWISSIVEALEKLKE